MALGLAELVARHERILKRAFAWALAGVIVTMLSMGLFAARPFTAVKMVSQLGLWSARLLLLTLAVSPLSTLWHAPQLKRWRRVLGLSVFAFAAAHVVLYLARFNLIPNHLGNLIARPYLLAGVIGFALLTPMAATANDWSVVKLTPKGWRRLHLLVYPVAALVVAHQALYAHDSYNEITFSLAAVAVFFVLRLGRDWKVHAAKAGARAGPGSGRSESRPSP